MVGRVGQFNGFGVPLDLAGLYSLASDAGFRWSPDEPGTGRVVSLIAERLRLMEATGRWRIRSSPLSEPFNLVPGDCVGLAGLHALNLVVGYNESCCWLQLNKRAS
jgi:hypothetical protein